ncbi:DUF6091 family protein [Marinobacteraceae bacterium S3BR75-40.1]
MGVQANAADLPKRSFCVFDPVGANGPLFNVMKSAKTEAMKWGVDLEMRAYTDEKIAAEEFKAGQCDSVLLTGTRAREFNNFTGSLEAIGAIPGEKEMRMVLQTLNQPKAADLLTNGKYEVAGILPAGSIYLFMRDRSINTVEELQGKKIATLDYDNAAVTMVRHVGASVVGANSANFAGKFNNGSVDLCYAPAVAYSPLELYKGVKPNGGIYNYRIGQMNFQIIINKDRFPENYANQARDYAMSRIDEAYEIISKAESEIEPELWIQPTEQQLQDYDKMLREVRISLRDEGTYNAKALRLMRVVRCKKDPTRGECALAME